MEQETQCNNCACIFLAWIEEDELGYCEPTGNEFTCPACGSEDTTCI